MRSFVDLSHDFLKPVLHYQAICVDATLGNGLDSRFFLSQKVKKVIAFEVQQEAIDKSNIQDTHFEVHLMGHEHMDEVIHQEVDAMIFNFGYCPGLDESIHTNVNTSLEAVKKGLALLKKKGRMALVFYPHDQGQQEAQEIENYLMSLDSNQYMILKTKLMNRKSPYLVGIEKIR